MCESIDELIAKAGQAIESGRQSIGVKFRPGWSVEIVRALRGTLPAIPLWIDADGLCTLARASCSIAWTTFFRADRAAAAGRRPGRPRHVATADSHVDLARSVDHHARSPGASGRPGQRPADADRPSAFGGLTPALALAEACRKANLTCLLGTEPQTSIGQHAALSLAAAGITTGPVDLASARWGLWRLAGCFLPRSHRPGKAEIAAVQFASPSPAPSQRSLERFLMAQAMLA